MKIHFSKTFWFRTVSIVLLIVIAVVMLFIGRKHIIYIDNKTYEFEDEFEDEYEDRFEDGEIKALYKVEFVNQDGETKKLYKRERGEMSIMGQNTTLALTVTETKGGEEVVHRIKLHIPFGKDAVVINVPALLAGLDQSFWMTDFVSLATTTTSAAEEEVVLSDDFGIGDSL